MSSCILLQLSLNPLNKTLLVVDDVHSRVAMGLQQSFPSSPYKYNIDGSFLLFITNMCFFTVCFVVVAFDLNQIIKLTDFIAYSQVNDPSIWFFLLLSKHNHPAA
jgi:hypothetical protein